MYIFLATILNFLLLLESTTIDHFERTCMGVCTVFVCEYEESSMDRKGAEKIIRMGIGF